MNDSYHVVIVGGGMAGLTASALLSKAGIENVLIEQNERLGGLISSFEKDSFYFDAGIRAFENQGILFPLLDILDIHIDFVKTPISIGFKDRWLKIENKEDIDSYFNVLKNLFPGEEKAIEKIQEQIEKISGYQKITSSIDNPLLMEEEDIKDPNYLIKDLLPWLLKQARAMKKLSSYGMDSYEFLSKFTDNQALIDMISQHFFTNSPASFALAYFNTYQDYYYPRNGTYELVEKLEQKIRKNGGKIINKCRISEIDTIDKYVKSKDRKIYYKKLIWAGDQKTLYQIIRPKNFLSQDKLELIGKNKASDSVLSLWLASDLTKKDLAKTMGPHAFYTPKLKGLSSLGSWRDIDCEDKDSLYSWIGKYLEYTTYEISIPSMRNEDLAPENKVGMIISSLFDYGLVKYIDENYSYKEFVNFVEDKIIEVFDENFKQGFSDKIIFSKLASPLTIEKVTGNYQGGISGWEFSDLMPSETSFKNMKKATETGFDDIYQVGQWTFSPAGIPVSILTARIASEDIINNK